MTVAMACLVTLGTIAVAVPAAGHDSPDHGVARTALVKDRWGAAEASRLSAPQVQNFRFISHLRLGGRAPDGDIWFQEQGRRRFVYVGTWRVPCTRRGVKIVNVSRPRSPKLVSVASLGVGGVSYEDPVVERIGRRWILGVGVQPCGFIGNRGVALFDVTRPSRPRLLRFLETSRGVHELDIVKRRGGRVLALLAVPFAERDSRRGDFQIADITKPRRARLIADWGVVRDSKLKNVRRSSQVGDSNQGIGYYAAHLAHSVRGADRGRTAYVSYWDGGLLKFDISRPSRPKLLGRTIFELGDDGDTHSMTPLQVGSKRYLLENDEDFDVPSPAFATSSATGTKQFHAIQTYNWLPTTLDDTGPVSGPVHLVGDGCQAADYVGTAGDVVLIEHVVFDTCSLFRQAKLAAEADVGAIVISHLDEFRKSDPARWDRPTDSEIETLRPLAQGIPGVMIAHNDGLVMALKNALGPQTLSLEPQAPRVGAIRIFDESVTTDSDGDGVPEYDQVGSFDSLPNVVGEPDPPAGQWSVHNTEVAGRVAFSSWYTHGVVAWDVSDVTSPTVLGRFVPPNSCARARSIDDVSSRGCFPLVWGLALDRERNLVYVSDMRSGLWIARPTGPAAP